MLSLPHSAPCPGSFLRPPGREEILKNVSDLLGSDFVGIEISIVTKALIVPEVTETTVLHSLIVLQAVEGAVSMASFFPEPAAFGRFCLQRLHRTLGSETGSWSPNVEMCLVGSRNEGGARAAGEGRGQRSDSGGFRDTEEGHGLSALYGAQGAMEAEVPCSRAQGGARGERSDSDRAKGGVRSIGQGQSCTSECGSHGWCLILSCGLPFSSW